MGDSPQENQANKSREAALRAGDLIFGVPASDQRYNRDPNASSSFDTFTQDPLFQALRGISEQIVAQPLTFGPEQRRNLYNQQASLANQEANAFLDESRAQLSGPGGGGARSGEALNREFEIGSRLGEALAESRRQTDLFGAQQDRADLLQAQAAAQIPLDLVRSFFDQAISAELGNAQFIASAAQGANRTSPGQAAGAGLGQLLGSVGSAAAGAPAGGGFLQTGGKPKG